MPQYDMSESRFVPGQPIAMHKSQFTPELQESIIRHHFDKSIPGGYETLSESIQNFQGQPDPDKVTISREEYENLQKRSQFDPNIVKEQVSQMFPANPVPNEQTPGNPFEPQPPTQAPQQALTQNESNDIVERLFGPQQGQQANAQQNDQTTNVNNAQNDDAQLAAQVRDGIASICMQRQIEPNEFIQFATALSMDDIADLYVAWKQAQAEQAQQQGQVGASPPQPVTRQAPESQTQAPINLAEVQPNPVNYQTEDQYKKNISSFWR